MNLPALILTAFGLSMDCFAVSVTMGTSRRYPWRNILFMALLFGLFQGFMPLIGWFVGSSLKGLIEPVDHWIAFTILSFIGLKMILQAWKNHTGEHAADIRKLSVLIPLSIATSIDALITGVGFGFIQVNILHAVVIITIITFLVSAAGAKLAETMSFIPARWAEFAGGVVLIGIGVSILVSHMSG